MLIDILPYTPEFESLYQEYVRVIAKPCSRSECWHTFLHLRKRGMLGRGRRRRRKSADDAPASQEEKS